MNIKQAKQEITNTLKAYLAKDELGNYLIPTVRQRPVLLMGPPGVGKTQIMEQIAAETGVGLVAYTITHHTRQSAIGLPFIEKRTYGGEEVSVTEYTMSEILSSVYRLMERTGLKEGILFLDEINCVSETLAPMMLQFLQCKTFGNQHLPEGWLIVAAGNPPEYNKSVRDFDVVTLDRVKRINVEEDYGVWKEYARRKGLHGAVLSYLDIKKDNFYRIENTADGLEFATARGWEDLSELLYAYEKLGIRADREVVGEYIQMPRIARDFANYLELYYKYQKTYHVEGILSGTWEPITVLELRAAPFDEKLSVMGLVLARLSEEARNTRRQDALTEALHTSLTEFREKITDAPAGGGTGSAALAAAAEAQAGRGGRSAGPGVPGPEAAGDQRTGGLPPAAGPGGCASRGDHGCRPGLVRGGGGPAEAAGGGDRHHVRQRLPFPGDHLRRQSGTGDLRHGDHRRVRHLLVRGAVRLRRLLPPQPGTAVRRYPPPHPGGDRRRQGGGAGAGRRH